MTILQRLLQHDARTTRVLLEQCADLPDAALDREFDIGHKSLRKTFVHIVANMECWCDLMTAEPQRLASRAKRDNTIGELLDRLDIVAGQLLALGNKIVAEKREDDFFIDALENPPRQKPFGAGLVHVATHGMHHRAQCLYIMRQSGMKNLIEGDAVTWEQIHLGLKDWPSP
jgi:uncharacterized damage-inducible protein DinB